MARRALPSPPVRRCRGPRQCVPRSSVCRSPRFSRRRTRSTSRPVRASGRSAISSNARWPASPTMRSTRSVLVKSATGPRPTMRPLRRTVTWSARSHHLVEPVAHVQHADAALADAIDDCHRADAPLRRAAPRWARRGPESRTFSVSCTARAMATSVCCTSSGVEAAFGTEVETYCVELLASGPLARASRCACPTSCGSRPCRDVGSRAR